MCAGPLRHVRCTHAGVASNGDRPAQQVLGLGLGLGRDAQSGSEESSRRCSRSCAKLEAISRPT